MHTVCDVGVHLWASMPKTAVAGGAVARESPWDDVAAEGEVGLGLVPEKAVAAEAACVAAGEPADYSFH